MAKVSLSGMMEKCMKDGFKRMNEMVMEDRYGQMDKLTILETGWMIKDMEMVNSVFNQQPNTNLRWKYMIKYIKESIKMI